MLTEFGFEGLKFRVQGCECRVHNFRRASRLKGLEFRVKGGVCQHSAGCVLI